MAKPENAAAFDYAMCYEQYHNGIQLPSIPPNCSCSVPELLLTAIAAALVDHSLSQPNLWLHLQHSLQWASELTNQNSSTDRSTLSRTWLQHTLKILLFNCSNLATHYSEATLTIITDFSFRLVQTPANISHCATRLHSSNKQFAAIQPVAFCAGPSTFATASVPDLPDLNSDKLPTPKAGTLLRHLHLQLCHNLCNPPIQNHMLLY